MGFKAIALSVCFATTLALPAIGQEPVYGGELVYGVAAELDTYDCQAGDGFAVIQFLAPHYSTLLRFDPKQFPSVTNGVAESWDISDDGLTYTFKLYSGVKFHDGTTLTSRDIKATYDRIINPPEGVVSVRRALYEDIASIETPDDMTVVFNLSQPSAAMLSSLASPYNCIYSADRLAEDPRFPEKNVMGTGPFVFDRHIPGAEWRGTRFDDYFREGLPYLDSFRAMVMNNTSIVNALAGGQIMAEFRGVSPAERDRIIASQGDAFDFPSVELLGHWSMIVNTEQKPFDDVRVRKALAMAIDRWNGVEPMSKITSLSIVGGLQYTSSSTALSTKELEGLTGFSRDITAAREEARRLLAEAGVPNLKVRLLNRSIAMPYSPLALYVIDQWRQIGVEVEHVQQETASYTDTRRAGNFDVVIAPSGDWSDDPSIVFARFISFDRANNNFGRYIDREVDRLYDAQARELDPAKRRELVVELESYLINQGYVIPVFKSNRQIAISKQVQGYIGLPTQHANQDRAEIWLSQK